MGRSLKLNIMNKILARIERERERERVKHARQIFAFLTFPLKL